MSFLKRDRRAPEHEIEENEIELELAQLKRARQPRQSAAADPPEPMPSADAEAQTPEHKQERHKHNGEPQEHAAREPLRQDRALERRIPLRSHNPDAVYHEYQDEDDPHAPRTLKSKLFGIGPSGYFQLAIVCIVVGAILDAGRVNPFDPAFTFEGAMRGIATGTMTLLGWALQTGWWPLTIGASVAIPLWLVWRLFTVPFRR